MQLEKAAETTFIQKTCAYKVDEIDGRSQFHQRFFARIFSRNFWPQVTFQLGAKNLCKKRAQKALMKLTTGKITLFGQIKMGSNNL